MHEYGKIEIKSKNMSELNELDTNGTILNLTLYLAISIINSVGGKSSS